MYLWCTDSKLAIASVCIGYSPLNNRKLPKSLITDKNVPKSPNQNHKRCVTKSPNKRQQKSRNVADMN